MRKWLVVTRGVLVALALALAAWSVWSAWRDRYPVPVWDMAGIEYYLMQTFLPRPGLESLLQLVDNEHRPYLPLLFYAIDHLLFRSQGAFLQIASLLCVAGTALLAAPAWSAPRAAPGRDGGPAGTLAAALLLALFLSPLHFDNLLWPKQLHVTLSLLLIAAAFRLATRSGRAPGPRRTAALCALAFGACFSFAYGFVALALLLAYALWRRWPLRRLLPLGLTAAGAVAILAATWVPLGHHADPLESLLQPLALARYLAAFLGYLPALFLTGREGASAIPELALLGGSLGLLAAAGLAALSLRRQAAGDDEGRAAGDLALLLLLLGVGTGVTTALGRLNFGLEQALTSRYLYCAACFWVGLAGLLAAGFRDRLEGSAPRAPALAGTLAGALFLAALAAVQPAALERQAQSALEVRLRGIIQVMGLAERAFDRAPGGYALLPPDMQPYSDQLFAYYRTHASGPYAQPWPHWLGRTLNAAAPGERRKDCKAVTETAIDDAGAPPAVLLRGTVIQGRGAAWLVLVDRDGRIAGLGAIVDRAFAAALLPEPGRRYRLFLMLDGIACRAGRYDAAVRD